MSTIAYPSLKMYESEHLSLGLDSDDQEIPECRVFTISWSRHDWELNVQGKLDLSKVFVNASYNYM